MADHTNDELLARIEELERLLAQQGVATKTSATDSPGADIWFLLDRSGSMASIASDVVRGFDQFFAEQRTQEGDGDGHARPVRRPGPARRARRRAAARTRCARSAGASSRAVARRCSTRSAACSTAPSTCSSRRRRRRSARRDLHRRPRERQPRLGRAAHQSPASRSARRPAGRSSSSAPTRTATRPAPDGVADRQHRQLRRLARRRGRVVPRPQPVGRRVPAARTAAAGSPKPTTSGAASRSQKSAQ